jgi:hypothetical protein
MSLRWLLLPLAVSASRRWDALLSHCVQDVFRYVGDAPPWPWVLERCALYEEACGATLAICNRLRDEAMPSGVDWPAASSPRARCDCYFMLFVMALALSCVAFSRRDAAEARPVVVAAEPVVVAQRQ